MGTADLLVSSESEHYGTPAPYVELSRYTQGAIDCDPASDAYWNHYIVKASTFYDERIDGLKAPWFGRVHLNAPSRKAEPKLGIAGIRIRPFWDRLVENYLRGEVDSAVWIGFQFGPLQSLQSAVAHPLQFFNLIPANRIDFLVRMPSNAPPQPCGAPMHGNYITLLPTRRSPAAARAMISRFVEYSSDLSKEVGGAIVRPL